jgi:hypothetical protein
MRAPRLTLALSALAVLAACGGVLFNQSNLFPCDFGQPLGVRDSACAPGDVCGTDGLCHPFVYEGPRFEGPPTLPDFSSAAGSGVVLHPTQLEAPIKVLGRDPLGTTLGGRTARHEVFGVDSDKNVSVLADGGAFDVVTQLAPLTNLPLQSASLVVNTSDTGVEVFDRGQFKSPGAPPARRIRTGIFPTPGAPGGLKQRIFIIPQAEAPFGEVLLPLVGPPQFVSYADAGLPGPTLDVAPVLRRTIASLAVLSRTGFTLVLDGGFVPASTDDADFGKAAQLKSDLTSTLYTVSFDPRGPVPSPSLTALSTWNLGKTGADWEFQRVWADCTPCPKGAMVALTPVLLSGAPQVQVLCALPGGGAFQVNVVGSAASDPTQGCSVEAASAPFDLRKLSGDPQAGGSKPAGAPAQDESQTMGVVFGGQYGQLWGGPSLSAAFPLFLDRVPDDVALVSWPVGDGGLRVAALTDRYLATLHEEPSHNGFEREPLAEAFGLSTEERPLGLVHEGQGWFVASSGELVRVFQKSVGDAGTRLSGGFGPKLVDGRGAAVAHVLWGEAAEGPDGGARSALIAADDSLYFVSLDTTPQPSSSAFDDVTPVLTPEPGTVLRGLTLERTPIATNGVTKLRAYAVTSRTLYRVQLSGSPPRWSATPIPLAGGEPLEVWMDNPRGGLGRVGYADGRVFTLPGGFQLVDALPSVDGGEPPRVVDYENLGGWPVALSSTGLFVATYGMTDAGTLDNRFPDGGVNKPMSWRSVSLPDGTTPWLFSRPDGTTRARPGRLFVKQDDELVVSTDAGTVYKHPFRLLLFLEDRVLQVGEHVRSNKSAVVQ